jgi:C_GCAxxG_C_C family probable redox protein
MNKSEFAVSTFDKGFNCAQSVLLSFAQDFGLDDEKALKISCGFGGGIACLSKTCGAVTGAVMVISLKNGRFTIEDTASKEKTYSLVKEFTKNFSEKYGSVECRDLLNCDISTPEGMQNAKDKNLFKTVCPKYVEDAVKILEQIL